MSFLKNNLKNILILTVVLAVSFYAYSYFFGGAEESVGALSVTEPTGVGGAVGADLLVILSDLRTMKLDESVFSDPVFRSLKNFRVELSSESIGRDNPFAPIGAASQGSSVSAVKIKSFSQ